MSHVYSIDLDKEALLRIQQTRQAAHARDAKCSLGVKTFLLCRARASRGTAFGRVPDAVCRLIAATAGGLFVAAKSFSRRREGMVFKMGGRGLGYYPDFAALEHAARERKLSVTMRILIINSQLKADCATPPASAEAWGGVLSRLQELDRITVENPEANFHDVNNRLLILRNSEGRRFLRTFISRYTGNREVASIDLTQLTAVEATVAELARSLVARWIVNIPITGIHENIAENMM